MRIVCTGRGEHPLKGYYTLEAVPADGTWAFVKRRPDGEWGSVKLNIKCRQCGRHVPLTPDTIQRLGLLAIADHTPTLDISLLS